MKPQLLRVPKSIEQSFSIRQDVVLHFYDRWHYHPELELVYIEQGSGTQFVGDNIQNFQSGDLLLIGSNLPHYWRCDEKYFQGNTNLYAKATVLHFSETLFGDTFLKLPENKAILELHDKSKKGMKLLGENEEAKFLILQLLKQKEANPLIGLLNILQVLSQNKDTKLLSSTFFQEDFDQHDTDRINKIYQYSLANFQQKISIKDVSEIANMSPHSFCRYFKNRSRKTYSQFLLELRVGHACKLLVEKKWSIAQICYESGFNNFANFNKYFKLLTQRSPSQYQKEYQHTT